jgi:hypothetical protein
MRRSSGMFTAAFNATLLLSSSTAFYRGQFHDNHPTNRRGVSFLQDPQRSYYDIQPETRLQQNLLNPATDSQYFFSPLGIPCADPIRNRTGTATDSTPSTAKSRKKPAVADSSSKENKPRFSLRLQIPPSMKPFLSFASSVYLCTCVRRFLGNFIQPPGI